MAKKTLDGGVELSQELARPPCHSSRHLLLPQPQRRWGQVSSLQKPFPNKALPSPGGTGLGSPGQSP